MSQCDRELGEGVVLLCECGANANFYGVGIDV